MKHPKSGIDCVPVEKEMQMLSGKRISTKRSKESNYGTDKNAAREAFQKGSEAINVDDKINSKAILCGPYGHMDNDILRYCTLNE